MPPKKTRKTTAVEETERSGSHKRSSGSSGVVAAGVVLVVFLLIVVALFSIFQTKLSLEVDGFNSKNTKTKAELMEEIEALKAEVMQAAETDDGDEIKQRLARLELAREVNCSSFGDEWSTYVDSDINWAFCYPNSWGEPELVSSLVEKQCQVGDIHWLRFPGVETPLLNYVTPDYNLTCDVDVLPFCWSCLGDILNEDNDVVVNLNLNPKEAKVGELEVGSGQKVVKVEQDLYDLTENLYQTTAYYIPKLLSGGELSLEIQTNGNEEEVEKMISSIYVR